MQEEVPFNAESNSNSARRVYIADIVRSSKRIPRVSGNDQFTKVRIFGTVISKRIFTGEGKVDYAVLTVDDGSGFMIQVKAWGPDTAMVGETGEGDVIDVIGRVRYKDEEAYIVPEVVRKIDDPNWEIVWELEIIVDLLRRRKTEEKTLNATGSPGSDSVSQIIGIVDREGGDIGIKYNELIKRLKHFSEDDIKKTLKELLDQGRICEPRPGRYRR